MAKLYFRYGAMNCGKTTLLLQVAHNYEEKGLKVIVIKPMIDKKGGVNIVSRLGVERKVDYLIGENEQISDLIDFTDLACILVDEVQFLNKEQIRDLWKITKLKDIPVICYGLRTDFKTNLFEGSMELFALADELEELITICKCGKRAKFNARMINGKYVLDGDSIAIDGFDDVVYEPMCGKCYIEKVLD